MWKKQRNGLKLQEELLAARVSPFLKAVCKYLEKKCSPKMV